MMITTYILVGLLLLAALWTVLTPTPLRAAIALAVTSALLTIIMFQMAAPLAGVFELSVCAGLITVVFISTISLTSPATGDKAKQRKQAHARSFLPLIGVFAVAGVALGLIGYRYNASLPAVPEMDVRTALWGLRRLDLLGQIIIIFVGVFGVVILFRERLLTKQGKEASK